MAIARYFNLKIHGVISVAAFFCSNIQTRVKYIKSPRHSVPIFGFVIVGDMSLGV